jgi:hypothetical protein
MRNAARWRLVLLMSTLSGILVSVSIRLVYKIGPHDTTTPVVVPTPAIITIEKPDETRLLAERKRPPLYGNLTCPFEWAKFSCFHQGRTAQAERGYELALRAAWHNDPELRAVLDELVAAWTAAPSASTTEPPKKLLLVGDSTMRQVFIALGCWFWRNNEIIDHYVDWATEWQCLDVPNCVTSGKHSGFNVGHFTLGNSNAKFNNHDAADRPQSSIPPPRLQVFFLPISGDVRFRQADIISRWQQELAATRHMTFSLQPYAPVYNLTHHDTIVYNIGLHVGNRHSIYRILDQFGRALLSQGPPADRPKLVYMNTFTQHFPTATGRFAGSMKHLPQDKYSCTEKVASNPLLDMETDRIRAGVNVDQLFRPMDEELGLHHVGGNDCTHYCMPGPPDVFAVRLLTMLHVESFFQR